MSYQIQTEENQRKRKKILKEISSEEGGIILPVEVQE